METAARLDETPRGPSAQPPPESTVGSIGLTQADSLQSRGETQSAVVAHEVLQRPELSQT